MSKLQIGDKVKASRYKKTTIGDIDNNQEIIGYLSNVDKKTGNVTILVWSGLMTDCLEADEEVIAYFTHVNACEKLEYQSPYLGSTLIPLPSLLINNLLNFLEGVAATPSLSYRRWWKRALYEKIRELREEVIK